jgi:ABC-type amino acid transport substrate-binding protein
VRTAGVLFAVTAAAVAVLLSGCGVSIPSDPSGTLESVRGGTLRAGVSPNDGFVEVGGPEPSGSEIDALRAFAASVDARVEWTVGSEEALVRELEAGDLDLVVGGLTDQTPWLDRAGVTRPYTEVTDDDGQTRKLVMLVPIGENAFLSELEIFLSDYDAAGAPQ